MKRTATTLLTTIIAGSYAAWCLAIGLSFLALIIIPLQDSATFYVTLIFTSVALDFSIFCVQIKKPAS